MKPKRDRVNPYLVEAEDYRQVLDAIPAIIHVVTFKGVHCGTIVARIVSGTGSNMHLTMKIWRSSELAALLNLNDEKRIKRFYTKTRCMGGGYNKFLHGIEALFRHVVDEIEEMFNIKLAPQGHTTEGAKDFLDFHNNWKEILEAAGFQVIEVISN
jgi:hypothetical protein